MPRNAKDDRSSAALEFTAAKGLRERTTAQAKELQSVSITHGPMFSRTRLGEDLRRLRTERKLSQAQLGVMVRSSGARISRLETGETAPDLALVMNIVEALEIDAMDQKALITLAREANEQTWWRVSGMPARQAAFAELEASASGIREFSFVFVPGLLQTAEYAQVRYSDLEAGVPVDDEAGLAGRLERQKVLTRPDNPVAYTAILDESVLRRRTAPHEVMRAQRSHLVEMASLPNVDIRVLPFDAEIDYLSPPLNAFVLYSIKHSPGVTVVETETSEVQVTDEDQTRRYDVLFERVQNAALDPAQTLNLIGGGT